MWIFNFECISISFRHIKTNDSNLIFQVAGFFVDLPDGSRDDSVFVVVVVIAALHGERLAAAGLPVGEDANVVAVDGALW